MASSDANVLIEASKYGEILQTDLSVGWSARVGPTLQERPLKIVVRCWGAVAGFPQRSAWTPCSPDDSQTFHSNYLARRNTSRSNGSTAVDESQTGKTCQPYGESISLWFSVFTRTPNRIGGCEKHYVMHLCLERPRMVRLITHDVAPNNNMVSC